MSSGEFRSFADSFAESPLLNNFKLQGLEGLGFGVYSVQGRG